MRSSHLMRPLTSGSCEVSNAAMKPSMFPGRPMPAMVWTCLMASCNPLASDLFQQPELVAPAQAKALARPLMMSGVPEINCTKALMKHLQSNTRRRYLFRQANTRSGAVRTVYAYCEHQCRHKVSARRSRTLRTRNLL